MARIAEDLSLPILPEFPTMNATADAPYQSWMCLTCGHIYNEAEGCPDDGIAPGTRWHDVPINWVCPECGARKDDFERIEI